MTPPQASGTAGTPALTEVELTRLHDASMALLRDAGVVFHDPGAVELFRRHGVRVDGKTVFPTETFIRHALKSAPCQFSLRARDPGKSVTVGGPPPVFAPGYGAPFVTDRDGGRRDGTMADYLRFCRLVQTSRVVDVNGFMMVMPSDVPPDTAHLPMLLANLALCDKPFMGSPTSREAARDALEMAAMVWGTKSEPVMISNINSLAPLGFAGEMAGSLMEFARFGQPVIVMGGGMLGTTSPVGIAGHLALQNATVLAGIALAQTVNPGTPVVYGVGGAPLDLRTGVYYLGAPEYWRALAAGCQLAAFYGLPSRGGGAVTDAHVPDFRAGMESAFAMSATVQAGVHFVLHACGTLGAYTSMSFEKFIADEELCALARESQRPVEVSDSGIDVETLRTVGPGGSYLTHPKTLRACRTAFHSSDLLRHVGYDHWDRGGRTRLEGEAARVLETRLSGFTRPSLGAALEKELLAFVKSRAGASAATALLEAP